MCCPRATRPPLARRAPKSKNLTADDVQNIAQIDSSSKPSRDMHTSTIAAAIAAGKPALVLFAVPGFCESRLCGPELEIMRKLYPKYKDKVEFIHVEFYKDPGNPSASRSKRWQSGACAPSPGSSPSTTKATWPRSTRAPSASPSWMRWSRRSRSRRTPHPAFSIFDGEGAQPQATTCQRWLRSPEQSRETAQPLYQESGEGRAAAGVRIQRLISYTGFGWT